jgi:CubicO group peptidase (beta-lactamase class C family)
VNRTACVILLALATSAAAPAAGDTRLDATVAVYLKPYRDLDVFQGVVRISRGGHVVFERAYGWANVELGVPNTPDRVFRVASLTKPFTEVALGRLVEEGRISLSDPLSKFIPAFPKGDSITLEMLRTHRAGIPSMNSIPYDEEASVPNTLDSLVRRIAREPLTFPPGSRSRYSNGGYALLGYVIEKASGRTYADYLHDAVLVPLGLEHTHHEADGALIANRAYGYSVSPETRQSLVVAPFQQMETKTGGGSLVSTAADLDRFLRAIGHDGVIRADTWNTLFPPDSVYAFQGRCPGFNVVMRRDTLHDVDVVVLCNNYAGGMVGRLAEDLASLALGRPVPTPAWRGDLPADAEAAHAFLGRYRAPRGALPYGEGPFEVRWRSGDLVLYQDGVPNDVLVPQGRGVFLLRTMWGEMRFTAAAPGQPVSATLRPLWYATDPVALERLPEAP